jgi:hypothetical protein
MPVVGSSEGNYGGFVKKRDVHKQPPWSGGSGNLKKKGNRTKELSEIKI